MNPEDRLRSALSARADAATTSPDAYTGVRDRIRRHRRMFQLQVASGALALSVLALVAVVELRPTNNAFVPVDPTPTASLDPTPSAAPTTPHSTPSPEVLATETRADTMVAVQSVDGASDTLPLVLMSARTGEVLRVLGKVPADPSTSYSDGLAISADRETVYFVGPGGDHCNPSLMAVDVSTGEATKVATGRLPNLSPDGRQIAVVTGCGPHRVTVVDLQSRTSRTYTTIPPTASPDDFFEQNALVTDVAWEDAGHLLAARVYEGAVDMVRLTLDGGAPPAALKHAVNEVERRGSETLSLWDCCYPEHTRQEIRRLDLSGTGYTTLLSRPTAIRDLQIDNRGVVLFHLGRNEVWRWDDRASQPRRITRSVAAIAW